MLRYLTGTYTVARGGAYLYNGVILFTVGVQQSLVDFFAGAVLFVGALFLLFAGAGLATGHVWAAQFSAVVLAMDVVHMVGSFVMSPGVVPIAWALGSLVTLALVVFKDPLGSTDRPDLDESESVHGMTSY